jgi:hypothetical protein
MRIVGDRVCGMWSRSVVVSKRVWRKKARKRTVERGKTDGFICTNQGQARVRESVRSAMVARRFLTRRKKKNNDANGERADGNLEFCFRSASCWVDV